MAASMSVSAGALTSRDAALLPLGGRDHHDVGHGGGHGRRGGAVGVGDERGVDFADHALDGGRVLLRRVCGHGGGRIGHDGQLLGVGEGVCEDAAAEYPERGGVTRTTQLYNRLREEISLDEIERIHI